MVPSGNADEGFWYHCMKNEYLSEWQIGIDRSLKKAVSNLHAIKEKYQYKNMQIRYVDMTKGVMPLEEEERLKEEKDNYVIEVESE